MRPGEFWEAMHAHNLEREADRRHIGELVRGATLRLFNIQVAPKSRISDATLFWPMPWDEIKVDEELEKLEAMTDSEKAAAVQDFLKKIDW